jgi:hypothetical protein
MAGVKTVDIVRRQKEARQKKLLLALVPVLVILLAVMGPRTWKQLHPAPAAQPVAAAPAATAEPGAAPTGDVVLADSDLRPEAGEDELVSFGRFVGRDPFEQLVEAPKAETAGEAPAAAPAPAETAVPVPVAPAPSAGQPVPGGTTKPPVQKKASAQLAVNGVPETVLAKANFPTADPVFSLAGVTERGVTIGLVGGAFSTGAATLDLEVGETLTLVAQPDGTRYEIKLVAVSPA